MGLNRALRRQQARTAGKKHQRMMEQLTLQQINERLLQQGIGQEDLDKARDEGRRSGFEEGCRQSILTCYAAAAKTLGRGGYDTDRIIDFLGEMDTLVLTTLDKQEIVQETLEETGISIRFSEGVERVSAREKREVLCHRCLYAEKFGSVIDCDMLDGVTAGKTVCKHFREAADDV